MTWKVLVITALVAITGLFFFGLGRDPREIPSPLKGKQAPAFSGTQALDGASFDSKQFKGKVALVSFWATWCTTCKADEPLIDSLGKEFKDNPDFMLLGIATQDSLDKVKTYLAAGNRPYPNLFDERGRLAIEFGVYGVPETYLIDRQGNIIEKIAGPVNRARLSQQIRTALAATGGKQG